MVSLFLHLVPLIGEVIKKGQSHLIHLIHDHEPKEILLVAFILLLIELHYIQMNDRQG